MNADMKARGAENALAAHDQSETDRVFENARQKNQVLRLVNHPDALVTAIGVDRADATSAPTWTIQVVLPC